MLARSKSRTERSSLKLWTRKSVLLAPVLIIGFFLVLIFGAYGETQIPLSDESAPGAMSEGNTMPDPGSMVEKGQWVGLFTDEYGAFQLRSWDKATSEQTPKPIFQFQATDALRTGNVETEYSGLLSLSPGQSLSLRSETVTLTAHGKMLDTRPGNLSIAYKIELRSPRGNRVVYEEKRMMTDQMPNLVWAGDLDRDGHLDLLIDLKGCEEGPFALFLSGDEQSKGIAALTTAK